MSAINKLVLRVECARHNLNAMCMASGVIDEGMFGAAEAAETAAVQELRDCIEAAFGVDALRLGEALR